LSDDAIACWHLTGGELIKAGILSSLDLAILEAYADSYGRWLQLLRLMKDLPPTDPNWRVFSRTARQAKQDFVCFAQELGATPVSRSRVSVSPGGGPSKFEHLIAGKEA
jgi:phage terminase small subunit